MVDFWSSWNSHQTHPSNQKVIMGNVRFDRIRRLACGVETLSNDNEARYDPPGDSGDVYCAFCVCSCLLVSLVSLQCLMCCETGRTALSVPVRYACLFLQFGESSMFVSLEVRFLW